MAKGLNLKAWFAADTSQLKKGSKEAADAIKSFENESSGALEALAGAFGVNIEQVQKLTNAGKGAGMVLSTAFKGANEKSAALLGTIGGIAGGLAALSVGAAVVTWKELNEQADYFYARMEGAAMGAGLQAYLDTMRDVITELNDPKGAAETTSQLKKEWSAVTSFFSSLWKQSIKDVNDRNSSVLKQIMNIGTAFDQVREAQGKALSAEEYGSQLREYQIQLSELQATRIGDLKQEYEQERLMARERNRSIEERKQHQLNAQNLLKQMIQEELAIRNKIIESTEGLYSLTGTTVEDQMALNQYKRETKNLEASLASQMRELLEYMTTLNNEQKTYNANLAKSVELAAQLSVATQLDDVDLLEPINTDALTTEMESFYQSLADSMGNVEFNLDPLDVAAARAVDAAKGVAMQINESFKGFINNGIAGFADLIGRSMAGTDNFADGLFAMFGDLLTQLGQVAVAAGVGMLQIKKAFESLNPWVAIAAGAALIALGSAISNSVSSLGSQIGTSGGGVAYGSGNSAGSWNMNAAPRTEGVEVTGRFEIKGDDLVAVIGRNQKRGRYVG